MSAPTQEPSAPTSNAPTPDKGSADALAPEVSGRENGQLKPKTQARGMSSRSSLRSLIEDANAAGIRARFFKGRSYGNRRDVYISADSTADIEAAKEFFRKWIDENPVKPREPRKQDTPNGEASKADDEQPTEAKPEEKLLATEKPERRRYITFVDLTLEQRRGRGKKRASKERKSETDASPEAAAQSSTANSESGAEPIADSKANGKPASGVETDKPESDEQGAAKSGGPAGAVRKTRRNKKSKKAKSPATPADPETAGATGEGAATDGSRSSESSDKSASSTAASSSAATPSAANESAEAVTDETHIPKGKRSPRRRSQQHLKVSQSDAVYVKLPLETTMEELRALLPDLPSVEITMGTLSSRTRRWKGRRLNFPEVATATITVGGDHQQKAIDTLKTKELHGEKLNPKPAYRRVLVKEREQQLAEEAKRDVEAPESEHVESKE